MERYPTVCSHLPVDFPVKASQSNGFQDWKHIFGRELCEDLDVCSTTVAGGNGYTHKKFRIHDGELFFTRAELKGCLDETLERIKKHIQYALQLWKNRKNQLVDYIVLSGGLGALTMSLRNWWRDTRTAVVSGLLGWRNDNAQALREYIARASYGIVVRNPPPSLLSASDFITQDGRVKWIVKYGSYIKYFQPITVKLTKYFNKNDPWTWTEEVMWLDKEERILPPRKIHAEKRGGEVLYRVDLGVVEGSTKLETVTSFMDSMVYLKCDFELALMIGPSGDCVVTVSKNTLKLTEREP
ncbi:hypothetical protein NXS19_009559 [Fusarium pseudograminearum]|nr:hypothetical protein NXS19_009559 [Fusarium pseudograminearum]